MSGAVPLGIRSCARRLTSLFTAIPLTLALPAAIRPFLLLGFLSRKKRVVEKRFTVSLPARNVPMFATLNDSRKRRPAGAKSGGSAMSLTVTSDLRGADDAGPTSTAVKTPTARRVAKSVRRRRVIATAPPSRS